MAMAPRSDADLVRYLLGYVDREDEERLDELSVIDPDFAERLRAVEHDLADAYARGELSSTDRERWEARYLASQHGRDDLALAQTLAARERTASQGAAYDGTRRAGAKHTEYDGSDARDSEGAGRAFRRAAWWPLAAAAVLVLAVATGYRVVHRQQPVTTTAQQPESAPAQRPAPAPTSSVSAAHVLALTLAPSVRSIGEPPTLEIPPATTDVKLTLRLDEDSHTRYRITVRDLTANAIVWNSPEMPAEGTGVNRSIVISIPASTFRTRRYLISVSAGPADAHESIATYPLIVMVQ